MEDYANEFQLLCFRIIGFPISISDVSLGAQRRCSKQSPSGFKGDGGPWEDIKHLIHYAITIDATYAQATKGTNDTKPRFDVM